jgi:hypothetical protein
LTVLLSIEKGKSFAFPPDELLRICEAALRTLGLEITEISESSGIIEAQKPSTWPFKSKEKISLSVTSDSRVVAVAKVDMEKAVSSGDLIVDRFFEAVKGLIQNRV